MLNNHLLVREWLKRCIIFNFTVILLCACYMGFVYRTHLTVLLINMDTNSHNQEFQGYGLSYLKTPNIFAIDKKTWQQTSMYEIFDKYRLRTNESCYNVCDKKNDLGCTATNDFTWKKLMLSPTLRLIPLLSEFQYIYPFEVDYLKHPPLTDEKQLPNMNLSKVYMDGAVDDEVFCTIGEVIKGRVDLVDGFSQQRTIGGDDVRAWIVDQQTKQYKAVGHVTDMRNGSYQISIRCLFPGKLQLNVAVAYPREYLRVVINQIHRGVTWFIAAKFRKKKIEEVTPCLATPNIPGRPCLCNFTSFNQQSFYCGRPLNSRLGCDDWVQTKSFPIPQPQNVTPKEYKLIKDIPKKVATISHNFSITVSSKGQLPSLKPCSETSRSVTWEIDKQPSGYWTTNNSWTSLICQRPKMTSEWAISCLKNSSLWVFGDSNGIRLRDEIWTLLNKREEPHWLYQRTNKDTINGITVSFMPLEYPLYSPVWRTRLPHVVVAKQIDNIPSAGTHVLVIHYYLHIAPSHLNIALFRLKAVHDAIHNLINRNPNVLVGIRGPHISSFDFDENHSVGGDNLGIYLLEMIRNVFFDLRHRVIFLDGWEMTIALQNKDLHPISAVSFEMMRTLLAFKCS